MARWVHLCWSLPVLLGVLALGALHYLAYTAAGLATVETALNRRIGPVDVQVYGASGTLAHGLHVNRVIIDHRRVHIEVEDATAQLAILPLLWRTIAVPQLHARRLLIRVWPHIDDGRVWEPHFMPALSRIEAPFVAADHGRLVLPSGQEYVTDNATASGAVFPKLVRIYSARFDYEEAHVRTSGDVLATPSIGVTGIVHVDAQPQNQPPWTVNAHLDGDMARLGLEANVSEPFAGRFQGEIREVTSRWHWLGRVHVGRFDLATWHAGHALGILTADLALQADHSGFQAQGTLTAPGLQCGPLDAQFNGSYSARVLSVSQLRLRHPASGTVLQAQGSVTVVAGGPRLDLHGDWSHFRWPLADSNAPFHSEHGSYTLQDVLPYAFTTQADLSTQADLGVGEHAALQISMRGRLATNGLSAQSAQIQALGARADISGGLHWAPVSDWQLQGRVSELAVARLRPQTSGQLNFSFAAAGAGFSSQAALQASVSDISGNVRGQRAQGHAQLAHRGGEWTFNDVRLQLGATHIELDGRAGKTVDLNFALNAADLGLFNPDARGQVIAKGHIHGDLRDPTIISNAQARNIAWHGALLQSLDANIEFDPSGSGRADSTLRLQGLKVGDRTLEQLTLHSEGTTANHVLALDANAEGLTLQMRGNGRYAAGAWQGEINAGQFGDAAKLHMALEAPAPVLLGSERVRLEPLCFHDNQTRLCLNATLEPLQRNVELLITHLPMRALTAGLTAATDYDGSLNVALSATGNADEPWRGTMKAQLQDAAIHKHFNNGRIETLDLGNGTVTARVDQHALSAELSLDAQAAGRIAGKFSARGSDDDWPGWPLNGELSIETTALGYVSAYVGQIDRASGRVDAQLHVTGTPASPRLEGELQLIHARLDAYQINLSLRDVNLTAKLADDTLSLDGSALAGPDGHASVQGSLRWQHGLPYGDLRLVGEDLRVVSVPEARVDASPDVSVHLAGRQIDLHGQVTLPYARIEPANLANAVLSSSDEVMVSEPKPAPEDQFQVSSNLTLTLGERVTVNTHGLSGRLSGSIHVSSDDSGINRGSGELNVEEGKYLACGRNLDIQHGRLLFSNGLLSDPGLDLRAVKKFPDITAGINVRGTLRTPRMTFFSDPEVSQSQIVSLLLAGGSLESVQNSSDTNERGNAGRSDALMQGGAILAQQLGGRYNIEAGVEQDMTNETSLVLGRYLSPRLYVSYGVGLAEAINTIKMRYTVGDHWTVKTEAGTQRSADLVFTIEK